MLSKKVFHACFLQILTFEVFDANIGQLLYFIYMDKFLYFGLTNKKLSLNRILEKRKREEASFNTTPLSSTKKVRSLSRKQIAGFGFRGSK